MVFKRRNYELQLGKQFMHRIQRNPKNRILMLYFTDPRYLLFQLMKWIWSRETKDTSRLEMVFKRENHELLLKEHFMQLIQKNLKNRTPMLYFPDLRYLPFELIQKIWSGEKKKKYKLEMVFKRENRELLLQKQFMQRIQRNPKHRIPILYFMALWYLPFQLMKKI